MRWLFGAMLVLALGVMGCSGDQGQAVSPAFEAMCETICARGLECFPDNPSGECVALCTGELAGIPCTADSPLLDECLDDIEAIACDELVDADLPIVCTQMCIGDCRTNEVVCIEVTYCDDATGRCLPGCERDDQCEDARAFCNIETHECACAPGSVRCDDGCIDEIEPTLTSVQAQIFEAQGCTASACHGGFAAQLGLDLSSVSEAERTLVNVSSVQVPTKLRVAPGDSSMSYLIDKLVGAPIAEDTLPMPLMGWPLCDARIDAVRAWIDIGAFEVQP